MRSLSNNRAASIMEYLALMMFLMAALYVFQNYIVRAMSGSWKKAGDTFGQGRQYDPRQFGTEGGDKGTLECFFKTFCDVGTGPGTANPCATISGWIDERRYEEQCDCSLPPEDAFYQARCLQCLKDSLNGDCADNP